MIPGWNHLPNPVAPLGAVFGNASSAKIAGMRFLALLGALLSLVVVPSPHAGATTPALPSDTRFYHAPPNPGAMQQARALRRAGRNGAAARITALAAVPQAVWLGVEGPWPMRARVS